MDKQSSNDARRQLPLLLIQGKKRNGYFLESGKFDTYKTKRKHFREFRRFMEWEHEEGVSSQGLSVTSSRMAIEHILGGV